MSETNYKPSPIVDINLPSYFRDVDKLCNEVASDKSVKIVTLCGSVRFKKLYDLINFRLSLKGVCVFSLASFGDNILGQWISGDEKILLDKTHKNKIKSSQAIVVINPQGYVGESTKSEIEYAMNRNCKIFYLSK